MFETVGVMAVSACILQMVYEKIEKQRPVVDYTEENKKFREQKEQEAKEWSVQILPYLEKEKEQRSEPPVICVEDLTMRFRIATNNVSGIKEYLIQTLRKQMSYKELYALNHINFNVYRGEIVGVIGTNGSGKSTLLKIVSGALNPTSGRVVVDQRKVQLLTLGTGFDFELSAKENVYLNGAIIGYSKAFIDEHYQEIVDFAELEGFMEEKVKNFSSGMVSRLGFSIATVAGAAEILILDEVLSVGDEFFRKKSLARIKELIHGGSTVLMVSHGMQTIIDNCTKVVWIEQGNMRMIAASTTSKFINLVKNLGSDFLYRTHIFRRKETYCHENEEISSCIISRSCTYNNCSTYCNTCFCSNNCRDNSYRTYNDGSTCRSNTCICCNCSTDCYRCNTRAGGYCKETCKSYRCSKE